MMASQQKYWYMMGIKDGASDGYGDEWNAFEDQARRLNLEIYCSRVQGSAFHYVHCTQEEADQLVEACGAEQHSCYKLDAEEARNIEMLRFNQRLSMGPEMFIREAAEKVGDAASSVLKFLGLKK